MRSFYGKYRGQVLTIVDPYDQGRIQVSVPAVLGEGRSSWAMPCVPFAGPGTGFFALPPVGANVWVEFEGGDPEYPIWTGCFWAANRAPVPAADGSIKMWKTDCITLTLDDTPGGGGFSVDVQPPAVSAPVKLVFDSSGISLTYGAQSLKLTTSSVSINDGALEVM